MDRNLAEELDENLGLMFIDIGKLVKTMDSKFEGQVISVSGYTPLKIGLYDSLKAYLNEREIKTKGKYELTQSIDNCLLGDREKHFGRIVVEKGALPEYEADYERLVLRTFRNARLRGNGIIIPNIRIDIIVVGFEEDYSTHYELQRTDSIPRISEVLKTNWFLTPYVVESLREQRT